MNLKKIVAAVAAAATAISMMAVNAFAFDMNSEYTGAWSASATIPKAEFEAIGGDVKVVITLERKDPLVGDGNYVAKPMNICKSWDAITDSLFSDSAIAKEDGFFVISPGQTTLEFVVPEAVWQSFVPYEGEEGNGSAGLAFQVNDVILKSAELSAADAAQGTIKRVTEDESSAIMKGEAAAPEADSTTTSTQTGNVAVASIVSVMALAGVAAVATKRK